MHEQASLAKLRRALLGCAAPHMSAQRLERLGLTAAEHAALTWREARRSEATSEARPITTFAIPLVGRHQVGDWPQVEATLARCLASLQQQSDPNWRVILCSQTRPAALDACPQASFLPFTQNVTGHDKVPKLAALSEYALREAPVPGFFMPLDGDDLLHRNFLQELHAHPGKGLLISDGAMMNAGTGAIARTRPRSLREPLQKPFWKFCGSCMALPTGTAPAEEAAFFKALAQHEHRLYPHLAHMAGITLRKSTAPLALYVINHGENFETRRGRGSFKQRFVARFNIDQPDALADLKAGFPAAQDLIDVNPRRDGL